MNRRHFVAGAAGAAWLAGAGYTLFGHSTGRQLLNVSYDATRELYRQWREVMTAEYEQLVAASRAGRETLLDPYGTTNAAEFFAVVTEAFFDMPLDLRAEHPRLYELLREYYRQDPAQWNWPPCSAPTSRSRAAR